jgi:protein CLEC16A
MKFLTGQRPKKYSIEQLRRLYGDLLRLLDMDNRNDVLWELRHQEAETSPRFSLGRKAFLFQEQPVAMKKTEQRRKDLASAFLALAASRSGRQNSQAVLRDEATVAALQMAKSLETSVIDLIRSIGEVVVNAEGSGGMHGLRSDPAFEYFCEKAILALLVEIVGETPSGCEKPTSFHGVVWSPLVKAQVFQTTALLVAGVRDSSALYYLLSQNCMNQLVSAMLPLSQWTDPALEIMLPPYVDMVKALTLQLSDAPHLFPFFTIQDSGRLYFPLFSATLQTGTSSFAQANSFVHATCLNLIVDVMQIPAAPIREWLVAAEAEQVTLVDHLCALLLRRYTRLAHLATGPVVDGIRSNAIDGQLKGLQDEIELLNDVFRCPLRGLRVRLCEQLLCQVVQVLWAAQTGNRPFLPSVGVADADVLPAEEGATQAATLVLSRCLTIAYPPTVRMMAVALWHPWASPIWTGDMPPADDYAYTMGLQQVVRGEAKDLVPNMFAEEHFKALVGDYGEWRAVSAAILMYQCLQCVDSETLVLLNVLPVDDEATLFEKSVAGFLSRDHTRYSNVSVVVLECMTSLAIQWIRCALRTDNSRSRVGRIRTSRLTLAMEQTKQYFFRRTVASEKTAGVSNLFVDLIESAVLTNYKSISLPGSGVRSGPRILAYNLANVGCPRHSKDPDVLVRKLRSVKTNEVELTRFYAQMALHFRAVVRLTTSFLDRAGRSPAFLPDWIDEADGLTTIFGSLRDRLAVGSDIDIRGRMSFPFLVDPNIPEADGKRTFEERVRSFSEDMIFRSASTLVVVLDPTDFFIVKPLHKQETTRGTVVCCVPLLNVIAAATDGEWIHIAVRHDDVGFIIKNGNMALKFDTPGTGLIVWQYIDRSRQVLRGELVRQIQDLFAVSTETVKETVKDGRPNVEKDPGIEQQDDDTLEEDKKDEGGDLPDSE